MANPTGTNQNIKNFQTDKLIVQDIDLHGRRVVNAGESRSTTDYITNGEVLELIAALKKANNLK